MSHFTQVATKLFDKRILIKSLKSMGWEVVEGEAGQTVRGFCGESVAAEFKIHTETHYDIGFLRNEEGAYSLVGDWELLPRVSGLEQDSFLKTVKRAYAKQAVLDTAAMQGMSVESVENEDGTIEMVVSQW